MLYRLQIFLLINFVNVLAKANDKLLFIRLDSDKIIDTLKTVITSEYAQRFANDFTKKLINPVIIETSEKEQKLLEKLYDWSTPTPTPATTPVQTPARPNLAIESKTQYPDLDLDVRELLTEHDAFTLIKDPSPDGDDLELENKEFPDISYAKFVPVKEVHRINGIYYRRLLELIKRM